MGIMKLGKKTRRRMYETQDLEATFKGLEDPEVFYRVMRDWFEHNGIRMSVKTGRGPFSKMGTAFSRQLKLPRTWNKLKIWEKAALLAHERVHYRQKKRYGFARFDAKYVFDPRFIIAMETPAYRENLRAYRAMGATEESLERYALGVDNTLWELYPTVRMLDRREVKKHVTRVMKDEIRRPT